MNYYKVLVKCGHVRRSQYILKWIFIEAFDGKEAAARARKKARVKHDHKDAIREVIKISLEEYGLGLRTMAEDPYFNVRNKQDQIRMKAVSFNELIKEEIVEKYKKNTFGRRLKEMAINEEWKKAKNGGYSYYE